MNNHIFIQHLFGADGFSTSATAANTNSLAAMLKWLPLIRINVWFDNAARFALFEAAGICPVGQTPAANNGLAKNWLTVGSINFCFSAMLLFRLDVIYGAVEYVTKRFIFTHQQFQT